MYKTTYEIKTKEHLFYTFIAYVYLAKSKEKNKKFFVQIFYEIFKIIPIEHIEAFMQTLMSLNVDILAHAPTLCYVSPATLKEISFTILSDKDNINYFFLEVNSEE